MPLALASVEDVPVARGATETSGRSLRVVRTAGAGRPDLIRVSSDPALTLTGPGAQNRPRPA